MRVIAIIITSFFFLSLNPVDNKKREIKVDCGIYTVLYSEALEQPKEVWYTVECTDGKVSRKGMDFYTNDSIYTSSKEDYENNEWDKGHMAPAAHFSCEKTTLYQTFSYLNCSLQHQDLNRGVWRLLEARERELAKKTDVEIHIVVDFTKGTNKLPTGATVPGGYRKEIKYSGKTEVYYFKNEKPLSNSFDKYIVKN
jgi:DNA/RNA endonuclease G (NUC1)